MFPVFPFEDTPALKDMGYDFPLSESWEWTDLNFSMNDPEDAEKWDHTQKNGIVVLAKEDVGGGQTYFLVISGEHKGEVWERDEGGTLRLPGCTFLDWVELYLSKQLISYTDKLFRQEKKSKGSGRSALYNSGIDDSETEAGYSLESSCVNGCGKRF